MNTFKKINLMCLLFSFLHANGSDDNISLCDKILFSLDFMLARLEGLSNQAIICRAAKSSNPELIRYCLRNKIGDPYLSDEDEDGGLLSPIEVARMVGRENIVKVIEMSPVVKRKRMKQE